MATSFYLKNNSSADNYPFLELQNNNSNNKSGEIRFIKNKDTTASNDSLGIIKFEGYDSSTTQKEFAQIKAVRVDDLILSESGFIFSVMKAGVMTESLVLYEVRFRTSTPGTLA